jgi:hypothetical protein
MSWRQIFHPILVSSTAAVVELLTGVGGVVEVEPSNLFAARPSAFRQSANGPQQRRQDPRLRPLAGCLAVPPVVKAGNPYQRGAIYVACQGPTL